MQPQSQQVSEYFKDLQKKVQEERGERNKVYSLAFLLSAVLLGLLSGKKCRSELYRYLENHFTYLQEVTGYDEAKVVSLKQFYRILNGVDWLSYNAVNERHFGKRIVELEEDEWVAIDGKELRGSIEVGEDGKKEKRGETVVNAVVHKDKAVVASTYYRGDKESERPSVRELLENKGLKNKSLTLDGLHCDPSTTGLIEQAGGKYLIQVKENQEILLEHLQQTPIYLPILAEKESLEKAHGRIEYRQANFYSIEEETFDKRWQASGFRTLAIVQRKTTFVKTGKERAETSYYISNKAISILPDSIGANLFQAIRGHWSVEADNYVRDVTFGEDDIKTPKGKGTRFLTNARTWGIQLARRTGAKNLKAQIEQFADCPEKLADFLRNIGFTFT